MTHTIRDMRPDRTTIADDIYCGALLGCVALLASMALLMHLDWVGLTTSVAAAIAVGAGSFAFYARSALDWIVNDIVTHSQWKTLP